MERIFKRWIDEAAPQDKIFKDSAARFFFSNYYSELEKNKKMILDHLKLTDLPDLRQCDIDEIHAMGNQFRHLELLHLPIKLSRLILSHNQLTNEKEITGLLIHNLCLKKLDLSSNQLCTIPKISVMNMLVHLDLNNNYIHYYCHLNPLNPLDPLDLDFKNYINLEFLSLSRNPLTCIPTLPLTLKELYLSEADLTDENVFSLKLLINLENLDLSFNYLTLIPEIGSKKIKNLNLNHNQIENKKDNASFENFNELQSLSMAHNFLTIFPSFNDNIQIIVLSYNQIQDDKIIERLEPLSNLISFKLDYNCLTILPFNFSVKLQYFSVSHNQICLYDLYKKIEHRLMHVDLSDNFFAPYDRNKLINCFSRGTFIQFF